MTITRKILERYSGGFIRRVKTERGTLIEPVSQPKDATDFSCDDYIGLAQLIGQARQVGHGVVVRIWQREDDQS